MADLSSKRYLDSIRHNLRQTDGTKLDIVFIIAGPSHPARTGWQDKSYVKLARQSNRAGKLALSEDPDEKRQDRLDEMCAAVLGWENVTLNGDVLPYSKDAVRKVLGDPAWEWILDDVERVVKGKENFIPTSSTD